MKKRWIPFIALTLVIIFAGGILLGSVTEAEQQLDFWDTRLNIQNTIAVVNSDVGVIGSDGERHNYSAAIIQALDQEFIQVSPALAETGFLDGTFGGVITFPSNFSANIMASNEGNPNRVQLEFMINPNLPEREHIEAFLRILNLQKSINTTLARANISSAFEQFHDAQSQVIDIFQSKEDGLTAMNIIELGQFTPSLNLEYIPEVPFEPDVFDRELHLTSVEGFASSVAGLYLNVYSQASTSFMSMQRELLIMSDEIPDVASGWLENLEIWADEWEEYGESLILDKIAITSLVGELNLFIRDLDEYLADVDHLTVRINNFAGQLDGWHGDLLFHLAQQRDFFEDLLDDVHMINDDYIGPLNDYIQALTVWHDNLEDWYVRLNSWLSSPDWVSQQVTRRNTLNSQVIQVGIRPSRNDFLPPYPEESPYYQDAVTQWRNTAVTTSVATMNLLEDLSDQLEMELLDIFGFTIHDFVSPVDIGYLPISIYLNPLDFTVQRVNRANLEIDDFEEETPGALELFQHELPEEGTPESAEGFLEPLSDLRGQLNDFDMEVFLTEDLRRGVDEQTSGFGTYLDFVREGLGFHVEGNNMLLSMIYFEYVNYLVGLRREVLAAEAYEIANLHNRLEEFYDAHGVIRIDTSTRLNEFLDVMPESRTEAGINRVLIENTITPFEFVPPVLRGDITADMFEGDTLYARYGRFLWIGIPLILLVFFITLSTHIISSKKEGNEKKEIQKR